MDDQRDYAEEEAVRRDVEREGLEELAAERAESGMDFVTFAKDSRRWWVLRGPAGAVSMTAIELGDAARVITPDGVAADGAKLLAECFTVHTPGAEECPALPSGCTGDGEALRGHREVFLSWIAAGHDDAVIRAALEDLYRREVQPS